MSLKALELKVPPLALAALLAAAMWGIRKLGAPIEFPHVLRYGAAAAISLAGGGIALAGIIGFRRSKTTLSPLKPERASEVVTTGIYAFTRNPMYLGVAFVLLAWAVLLASAWALVGPLGFVLYMNHFQIAAEERILLAKFGERYAEYQASVRRWL